MLAVGALTTAWACTPGVPTGSVAALAITDVTVVDVVNGALAPASTIIVKGSTIEAVGREVTVPRNAQRIDGTGRFLIPGLWDMHAHHQGTGIESLDLFVANGVVGTRDMGSDLEFILPLRERIRNGDVLGPEIVAAGPILDAAPPDWPFRRRVSNAEEARVAVRELAGRGVDFIKVHYNTPRDAFFAIAEETRKLGLPFAGHVPRDVTVAEAADAGMASIEHLSDFRVFRDCSGPEPYSLMRCHPLFQQLITKHVWQTPTEAFVRSVADVFEGQPMPHSAYASEPLRELNRKNIEGSKVDANALASYRKNAELSLTVVRDLAAQGAQMLAGCDGAVPGFCLHDELESLTEAGLSPLQALQTATINPARFLKREAVQGTVAPGQRADLILLDANPVADIQNVRRIAAVVVRGQLLSSADIQQRLAAHRRTQ